MEIFALRSRRPIYTDDTLTYPSTPNNASYSLSLTDRARSARVDERVDLCVPKRCPRTATGRIINIYLGARDEAVLPDNVRRLACADDLHLRGIPLSTRSGRDCSIRCLPRHRVNSDYCSRGAPFRGAAVAAVARVAAGFHATSAGTAGRRRPPWLYSERR